MPYKANVYRVMIASPSDVAEERLAIPQVISMWNNIHSSDFEAVLLPIKWETHATPQMGIRPQEIINKQLVHRSDILIAVFWTRLGTPTGKAESGSVEEIEEFRISGKPVLLYFSNSPIPPEILDSDQYKSLKTFKEKCFQEGLVSCYDSTRDFCELLHRHLIDTVRTLQVNARDRSEITITTDNSTPSQLLKLFASQYEYFFSLLESEWEANGIADVEKSKHILQRASDRLLDYRTDPVIAFYPEMAGIIGDLLNQLKLLQEYQPIATNNAGFWITANQTLSQMKGIPRICRQLLRIRNPKTLLTVHFLHPRSSKQFTAEANLLCTGQEALEGLLKGDSDGPFLEPAKPERFYMLIVARSQQRLTPNMTFEQAGVIDDDIIQITESVRRI